MHKVITPENEITHGQKFLLDLMEQRKLAEFARSSDINRSMIEPRYLFSCLFHIGVGQVKYPTLKLIYLLRRHINPAAWFYVLNEELPEFKVKLNSPEDNFCIEKTINWQKLSKMYQEKKLFNWCKEKNINYVPFSHLFNGHYGLSTLKIKQLKNYFDPAGWFIYCDEI